MNREETKRRLEAAGCEIIGEDNEGIIASCRDATDIPRDIRTERVGNNTKFLDEEE